MHSEFTMLMSTVLDGEATPAERVELDAHVAHCPACARQWVEWRTLHRRLSAAPMLAPRVSLLPGVLARLEQRQARRSQRRWLAPGLLLAWFVLLVVLTAGAALLIAWGFAHPIAAGLILSAMARLLSGVSWWLRGLSTLTGLVSPSAAVVLGLALLGATASLGVLWAWALNHSARWVGAPLASGG